MALDLNQSNVDFENPVFKPMLKNLQANILKGHGRDFAYHMLFKFDASKITAAKAWIRNFAHHKITSAHKQLKDTSDFNLGEITDGGPIYTLSISASGYKALGVENLIPQTSGFFKRGMKNTVADLSDNLDDWEAEFNTDIDMLIIVADMNSKNANKLADEVMREVGKFSTPVKCQRGNVLKMNKIGIEHFGYADGISQPLYVADDIAAQRSTFEWNDQTNLIRLLVPDAGEAEDSFGSYLVFRKLDQNVRGFKDAEGDNGDDKKKLPDVLDKAGHLNDDLPGALMVGRFENSKPVVQSSTGHMSNPPVVTNDFNYANDLQAIKCPFHAHTRLMNPRNGDTQAGDVSERRITRRGIPYDDVHRFDDENITNLTEKMLDDNQPESGIGLLFMCYQNNIDNQFAILQEFWANAGNINGHDVNGNDSIISQGAPINKTFPKQWGKPEHTAPFNFGKFVTNKGGEYFFTPSISFLETKLI